MDSPGLGGLPDDAPPADPSASDEVLGVVDAGAVAGPGGHVRTVAAGPGGSFVVLAGDTGATGRTVLAEYVPGAAGPELARTVEIPPVDGLSDLHVAPDGTVLVIGELRQGDGSTLLVRLAPGATQAQVLPVDTGAREQYERPAHVEGSALSPDGATLYVSVNDVPGTVPQGWVVAVDAATGAVTDRTVLDLGTGESDTVLELAVRPDGAVVVLAYAALDGDGEVGDPVLVEFDAALEPVAAPVRLSPISQAWALDLRLLPDGGAVVLVDGGSLGGADLGLAVVRDGTVERTADLDPLGTDRPVEAVAVSPDGRGVAVPYVDEDRAGLATLDLGSGEVVADVPLCDGESISLQAVPVAGGVAAVVGCTGVAGERNQVTLIG